MTGAELLLRALEAEGVDTIFGYPGGANLPIYDTLPRHPKLHHILVRHEQGAGHMADGYARASGRVGVCFATSGPGALNLVTALATAQADSVPVVAITGQVSSLAVGTDAFQESDVIGVTASITKHNFLVTRASDIPGVVARAFSIAMSGRPGVVLIDICKDAQTGEGGDFPDPKPSSAPLAPIQPDPERLRAAMAALLTAERPLILAGHGVIIAKAEAELLKLAQITGTPVGTTLLGVGSFPVAHPLSVHMTGFTGTGYALRAVQDADLLLMVGMRVDDRVTVKLSDWAPRAQTLIHIDIDDAELGKSIRAQIDMVADAKSALSGLNALAPATPPANRAAWLNQIDQWKEEHALRFNSTSKALQPQEALREMYAHADSQDVIVADVGSNQIWAALWWNYSRPGLFLNSGGAGTMGYGIPGAIGAQFALPDRRVWCVVGDGGFVMTMQELSLMVEYNLPIKVVLFNNSQLGMVRQHQDLFYKGGRSQVLFGHHPNFQALAAAYGIPAWQVTDRSQISAAFAAAVAVEGPAFIEVVIDPEANVYPIVPAGKGPSEFVEYT
jgi:acetolactate synthase-1/2/3 large subunit